MDWLADQWNGHSIGVICSIIGFFCVALARDLDTDPMHIKIQRVTKQSIWHFPLCANSQNTEKYLQEN